MGSRTATECPAERARFLVTAMRVARHGSSSASTGVAASLAEHRRAKGVRRSDISEQLRSQLLKMQEICTHGT